MLIFPHYSRVVWSYNHKTSRSVWPTINVKETVVAAQRSHVSASWSPGLGFCIFTEALSILHCCSTMRSFSSVHRFLCRFGSAGQVGHSMTPLTCCSFGLCFVDVQEEPPELVALMLDLIWSQLFAKSFGCSQIWSLTSSSRLLLGWTTFLMIIQPARTSRPGTTDGHFSSSMSKWSRLGIEESALNTQPAEIRDL